MKNLGLMITAAFGEIFRRDSDDSVTMTRTEFNNLQELINKMQTSVDKYAKIDLKDISNCTTIGAAKQLQEDYNTAWFMDSMYSLEVLQNIATTLLDVSEPFYPGNALWIKVAGGIVPLDNGITEAPVKEKPKPWVKNKEPKPEEQEAA